MECASISDWFFYVSVCVWLAVATVYAVAIRKQRTELQSLHAEIIRDLKRIESIFGKAQPHKGLDLRD